MTMIQKKTVSPCTFFNNLTIFVSNKQRFPIFKSQFENKVTIIYQFGGMDGHVKENSITVVYQ